MMTASRNACETASRKPAARFCRVIACADDSAHLTPGGLYRPQPRNAVGGFLNTGQGSVKAPSLTTGGRVSARQCRPQLSLPMRRCEYGVGAIL